MKKPFVILFSLISFISYCQDTVYIAKKPNVVTIVKFDCQYIYCKLPNKNEVVKLPLSSVDKYVLYDTKSTIKPETRTNPEYSYYLKYKGIDSLNYKIGYIRYNLGQLHKEFTTGIWFSSIGFLTALSAPYFIKTPEDYKDYPAYSKKVQTAVFVGAGIALIGTIISLDSYKWIKRASIEPTLYGAKFNYKF
jgi:hypothetical protein